MQSEMLYTETKVANVLWEMLSLNLKSLKVLLKLVTEYAHFLNSTTWIWMCCSIKCQYYDDASSILGLFQPNTVVY